MDKPMPALAKMPILRRWLPSLRKRWLRLRTTNGHAIKKTEFGTFLLQLDNYVDRQLMIYGAYERAQIYHLISEFERLGGEQFFDVGANFGLYTIAVSNKFAHAKVHAFEPDWRDLDQFHGYCFLNELGPDRVTVHPYGLSDREGSLPFRLMPATSTGQSRVATAEEGANAMIDVKRFDDQFVHEGKVLFFKIDVEGHERSVLNGMTRTLGTNRCFLQMEHFGDPAPVEAILSPMGYIAVHHIGNDHYFTNITD